MTETFKLYFSYFDDNKLARNKKYLNKVKYLKFKICDLLFYSTCFYFLRGPGEARFKPLNI
jgi:hypothetical protein